MSEFFYYTDVREKLIHRRSPIIAIEGNTGVGKSTLLNGLGESEFPTIGEYHDFLEPDEHFPNFPPRETDDVISSFGLWEELEKRRLQKLPKINTDPMVRRPEIATALLPVIMDRSPLSLLAFEEAKRRQGLPSSVTGLARFIRGLYENGIINEPQGFIYLYCSTQTIQRRRAGRVLPFLTDPITINVIHEFMSDFFFNFVPKTHRIIIDTDEYDREATLTHALNYIRNITEGSLGNEQPLASIQLLINQILGA